MVTVIIKGSEKEGLKESLDKALKSKGVDTHKYCGVKLKEDPLTIQRRMRNEGE